MKRSPSMREARIRLLSDELDRLRASAVERSRSIETKASFVVVAAGVVATGVFSSLLTARLWILALIPVVVTIATVVAATLALWPTKINTPSAREVVDNWVDDDISPAQLEDTLLEMKAVEVEYRNESNESKGRAAKWSFALLLASLGLSLVVLGVNSAMSNGESDGKAGIATPVPASSEAP